MRTHIFLYVAALWPSLLLAQDAANYQLSQYLYWFDDEASPRITAYSDGPATIDASALDEGFHTLHYQVLTNLGQASPVRTTSFYRITPITASFKQYDIQSVRYWYDDEKDSRTVAYQAGTATFDASALDEGFHTLHYQVLTDQEHASPVRTTSFYRVTPITAVFKQYDIQSVRYWYDDEKNPRTVAYQAGTATFDASTLDEGFHTLHYQVVTAQEQVSPVRTTSFYRITPTTAAFKQYTVLNLRYWYDDEQEPRTVAYHAGTATFDASMLDEGFHTLHYQVVTNQEQASPVRTTPFYRIHMTDEDFKDYALQTVRYWFDSDLTTARTQPYVAGQQMLDLSNLSEGAHTMTYQVLASDGQVSPARTVAIDRWLYDIYVSKSEEYNDSTVSSDPLFATRPDLKLHFLADDTSVRGHLTVDEGTTLSLGKFVQTANWGSKNDGNKYTKTGVDYYHPTTLLNNGTMRADSVLLKQSLYRDRWHFLSLPFNANVSDIEVPEDTYWALRSYDGAARAAGLTAETWNNVRSGEQMEAGKGYILQLTKEDTDMTSWLTFKSINDPQKNNIFTTDDVVLPLEEHQAEFAHNRSWNLVGNPYPCFFDSRYIDQEGTIIVWSGTRYDAYSLTDDNYVLMPFEAFFIQRPVSAATLTFSKEGRQHDHNVRQNAATRTSRSSASRQILNFTLEDSEHTDRCRVVINEQASMAYESDKDAPKFMETRPQTPQLFCIESGVQYAINERPLSDGLVKFSVYASTAGEYRFGIADGTSALSELTVYDTETGTVWSLADGDYVFSATEGMHDGRLMVSLTGTATAISKVEVSEDGEIQVVGGELAFSFAKAKNVKVYSVDGRNLYNGTSASARITLQSGVYVVDVNGKRTKITVK